jgi:hypothetical protein
MILNCCLFMPDSSNALSSKTSVFPIFEDVFGEWIKDRFRLHFGWVTSRVFTYPTRSNICFKE